MQADYCRFDQFVRVLAKLLVEVTISTGIEASLERQGVI